jgi:hypothetical protein
MTHGKLAFEIAFTILMLGWVLLVYEWFEWNRDNWREKKLLQQRGELLRKR